MFGDASRISIASSALRASTTSKQASQIISAAFMRTRISSSTIRTTGRLVADVPMTYSVPTLSKCSARDSFREKKAANRTRAFGNVRPFPGGQYCSLLISPGAEDLWSVETVTSSISAIPQNIPALVPDSGANCEGRQCSKSNSVRLKMLVPLPKQWWTPFVNL
jgi:hypothetical protein